MKNFKKNILLTSLTLSLLASGCGVSKTESSSSSKDETTIEEALDEYLVPYIEKRNALEQEIANLKKEISESEEEKENIKNDETFYISSLNVIETGYEDNPSELFIIEQNFEYHHLFYAQYKTSNFFKIGIVYYSESYPLFSFLTEEEIEKFSKTNGEVTTSELDEILARLRKNYHEGLYEGLFQKSSYSLTLN